MAMGRNGIVCAVACKRRAYKLVSRPYDKNAKPVEGNLTATEKVACHLPAYPLSVIKNKTR
jgi:hypothetical protein